MRALPLLSAVKYPKWRRGRPSSASIFQSIARHLYPACRNWGLRVLTNPFTPAPERATYKYIPRPTTCSVEKGHCAGVFCALAPRMTRKGLVSCSELLACVQILHCYQLWFRLVFATVLGGCLNKGAGTWFHVPYADFLQVEC
jgi:hypothetical protein